MNSGLIKSIAYIFVILLSYVLKKNNIFTAEHYQGITKLIMKLTLPCVVISGFKDFQFRISMLAIVAIGTIANIILSLVGMGMAAKRGKDMVIFNSLIYSGFNVGCFALPFIQAYMPNASMVPVFLFDTGNSIMTCGGTYAIGACFKEPPQGNKLIFFLKRLTSSLPFDFYILMLLISMTPIKLPDALFTMAGTIGSANAILAMFMLGGAMEISLKKEMMGDVITTIIVRYLCNTLFALLIYYYFPFDLIVRQILVILIFAPASVMAVIFAGDLGLDKPKAGLISSVSIPISVICTTLLINFFHLG